MAIIRPLGVPKTALKAANIGQDYWEVDFINYKGPENAKNATIKYLTKLADMREQGVGILYVGPFGPGKTTLTMIVAKYLVRARWTVHTTSLGEIVEHIQTSWKRDSSDGEGDQFLERCRKSDFLFIDDLGKEHRGGTGFVNTVFDNLIRYRVQHRLPTFITTNFTKSELENTYGESLLSLLEGKLLTIVVDGKDYRRTTLKEDIRKSIRE